MSGVITLGIPDGRLHGAPMLVALGRGWFERAGLDVQRVNAGSHRTGVPRLAAGEFDVSPQAPLLGFLQLVDPSRPMVMVADQGSVRPGRGEAAIVARPSLLESGALADYTDLRGKRIGLSAVRGDHYWLTFAAALRRGGLTFDDVEVVICEFGDARHEALRTGAIDVGTVNRLGSLMEGRESGAFVVWKHEYEFRQRQERAVVFSYRFWSERTDEAYAFVAAYLGGLREYYRAFEEGIELEAIAAVLAAQSGESVEAILGEMIPMAVDPDGFLSLDAISADVEWLQQQRLIEKRIAVADFVDYRYLEAALQVLGRYQTSTA
ncbi:MAG: transporter, substrate-binding protein, aliphatic sulfonates family [Chloroflexi bacterium]|nr:transporter, substrate-binding protein, aliphatic sulfonates family [Chloroflexota bacterium]